METSISMNDKAIDKLIRKFYADYSKREKEDKVERFRHLNPYVKKGQILFAGSSLMEQFPIYEFLQDFDLPYNIYNRGIGGYTTAEMLQVMKECIYDLAPNYIFLNIGTNDLNEADYSNEKLIENYTKILNGIKENSTVQKIFLLAYYPVNPIIGDKIPYMKATLQYRTNERIQDANRAVEKLAQTNGAEFLDFNYVITDEHGNLKEEYTIEGMHMYANGYRELLKEFIPILQSL